LGCPGIKRGKQRGENGEEQTEGRKMTKKRKNLKGKGKSKKNQALPAGGEMNEVGQERGQKKGGNG